MFKVLPFGLSSACYFFTKLLVKFWRGYGLRIVVYLDDGIYSVQADRAKTTSEFVQSSLEQAGFVAHSVKSQWTPSYQILVTYSVTVRILAPNNFNKSFINKVLEYTAGLNKRTKFVSVAMCSLGISLC